MKKVILAAMFVATTASAQTNLGTKESQSAATAAARKILIDKGCLQTTIGRSQDYVLTQDGYNIKIAGAVFKVGCSLWKKGSTPLGGTPPVEPPKPPTTPVVFNLDIRWATPTKRKDGSVLKLTEIKGYNIYLNNGKTWFVNAPAESTTVGTLPAGVYSVTMTTLDIFGKTSDMSVPVTITVK